MPNIVPNGKIVATKIAAIIPQIRALGLPFNILQLAKAIVGTKIAPNNP